MAHPIELYGRGVLVTGAADGIGLALARALRAAGARVVLSDLAADRLEKTARALGVPALVCDVTDADAMVAAVDRAWQEIGPIDLLCANAGVARPGALLEVSRQDIDWQFDVNVWGVLNTIRPFVQRLRAEGRPGHILVTGSEASLSHPKYIRDMEAGVYHMTKHAVLSLADGLRAELASDDIGVSVLCPGPVPTDLAANSAVSRAARSGEAFEMLEIEGSEETGAIVGERLRSPEQIAQIALEGLREGLFVIPTHPHIRQDVETRYREIERGLDAL
jgi:NAD(P)-dependent dehydrogenase (short-subunit alcohol dehydrogenase family)